MKSILIFLISFTLSAQNLVPNPSFELYTQCPNTVDDIGYLTEWRALTNHLGTPDFFNICATTSIVSVPQNQLGTQIPFDGNAYAGLITYSDTDTYREYIYAHLTSPLIAGQTYFVSLYVSLAENSRYASNNIGAYLSQTPLIGNGTWYPLNITPNIWSPNVIVNQTDWTLISGTYQALGNEQYITLGNFHNDANTTFPTINSGITFPSSYYYIDQVIVSTTMSNHEFNRKKIITTPNPTNDEFSFIGDESEVVKKIELYDQYGRSAKIFNASETSFRIKELPTGIYYLTINYESGKKSTTKVYKL